LEFPLEIRLGFRPVAGLGFGHDGARSEVRLPGRGFITSATPRHTLVSLWWPAPPCARSRPPGWPAASAARRS
jgi:hypothetical protein